MHGLPECAFCPVGCGSRVLSDPPAADESFERTAQGPWATLILVGLLLLLVWPGRAFADIGLPMVAIYLPPAWVALFPIIAIEAGFGVWRFKVPAKRALIAQAAANCVSTLIGLPIAWMILALIEVIFFGSAAGLDSPLRRAYAVTVQSPWLIPYESEFWWMIPVSVGVLTIPFYVTSVVSEYVVVGRFVPDLARTVIWSWVWKANLLSYAFLLLIMGAAQLWPKAFQGLFAPMYPISEALVIAVFWLASLFHAR